MKDLEGRAVVSVWCAKWPSDKWRVSADGEPVTTDRQREIIATRYNDSDAAHDAAREAFPEAIIYVG